VRGSHDGGADSDWDPGEPLTDLRGVEEMPPTAVGPMMRAVLDHPVPCRTPDVLEQLRVWVNAARGGCLRAAPRPLSGAPCCDESPEAAADYER